MQPKHIKGMVIAAIVLVLLIFGKQFYVSVDAGHVAVATLFGEVQKEYKNEGLNFPTNPFYEWHVYDVRQKTHRETARVPSQDQLQTNIELSVQFRLIGSATPSILKSTGTYDDVLNVHLIPKLRSLLREQGKSIKRAEDFFMEKTQDKLQTDILAGLQDYLQPMGVEVGAVLIRDITLPPFIVKAIEAKKEREQAVVKQKAELERFETEQQQKVAQAKAEKDAALQESEKIKLLADARAYEIKKLNGAIANNPAYIKLQALKSLEAISKDKGSKIYFINGDSPNPLPLMHLGEK